MNGLPPCETPPPRSGALAWLTDAGPDVPAAIRSRLLDEMVGSPLAALAGPLSGMLLIAVGLAMQGTAVFLALLLAETALLAGRIAILHRTARRQSRGLATAPDAYLVVAAVWCALQGATGWACMRSGVPTLQIVAAASVLALVGPICARNHGAPRFAMLLIALSFLPLVAGAQTLGEPWLLVMVVQVPLLFVGAGRILHRYHALSVAALCGQAADHERAVRDPLTGLFNRHGLQEALHRRCPPELPFALLYLDLDGFKPVNDTFGHQAGDTVLVAAANRLLGGVRTTDVVARMGGDEFLVALPGVADAEAHRIAEELIGLVSDHPFELEGGRTVRVGVSVGYACTPARGPDMQSLIRKADAALYTAKAAGKGVVRRFGAPEAKPAGGGGFRPLQASGL